MRNIMAVLIAVFCVVNLSQAQQCDKKFKLKVERVVTINADGSEGEEIPFTVDIVLGKDSISITLVLPDGNTAEISGKHNSTVCKMNADYSNGTIDYKTDAVMNSGGQTREAKMTFNVEAKDGKLKVFGVPDDQPGEKICFFIKENEEVK